MVLSIFLIFILQIIFLQSVDYFHKSLEFVPFVVVLPLMLKGILFSFSESVISLLAPREFTQKVLDEASFFNIEMIVVKAGEILADSTSMICKLINSVDNSQELAGIDSEVPEEMICTILSKIMTDPVGTSQSYHRFEREAIIKWLKVKQKHPFTNLPLTANDLFRDFKLKVDIDQYVAKKLLSQDVYRYKNKAGVALSLFTARPNGYHKEEDFINNTDKMSNIKSDPRPLGSG